jgi:prepilin-type N-terminal cleavage/methylation domain-containing protein
MSAPRPVNRRQPKSARGFSLIEAMVTLLVLGLVMTGLMAVLQASNASRARTLNGVDAREKAAAAIEMIAADLRSAGSGNDGGAASPQTPIAYVDSLELMVCGDESGGVTAPLDTLAYNPLGTPKPVKLAGSWAPPIKYRTGAELIRWTLDLNNDGAVDASDINSAFGVDVRRTRNPNDYMLIRQIYGDSLNDVAGDNGGAVSRIAPVLKPGGTVPVLYTVIMTDGTTWNWSSGAVPAAQLKDIARIMVKVTAESNRPDSRGKYARVTLSTAINVARITL